MLQLVPLLLLAQGEKLRALFPERPSNYLTDMAQVVDEASARDINDLASRLRQATGAELAVVTLPTIGDYSPNEVALTIGRSWGVGRGDSIGAAARNAGMVLLLVPRTPEHKGEIYLATGRGIEGIITDATSGRITDLMLPSLREAQYGPALLLGTRAIASIVAKGFGVTDSALAAANPFVGRQSDSDEEISPVVLIVIIILVILLLSFFSRGGGGGGRGRRGPRVIFMPPFGGGGWGSGGWGGGSWGGGGGGGGGFGGFGGGGGFSGGGGGRSF
ncbi:MAG: TPM domain-containing protein [Gemmatimonadales bacterium]